MKNHRDIDTSELSEEQQQIVSIIGVDSFIALCQYFGGSNVYIPKQESVQRFIRNERIRKEFNGGNYKALSRKYNLSISQLRRIIDRSPEPFVCSESKENQLTIFDL